MLFDKTHANWSTALTFLGVESYHIDIGELVGAGFGGAVTKLTIRETQGNIYVNYIEYGGSIPIPEPATIAMFGFGIMIFALPGRRANRQK